MNGKLFFALVVVGALTTSTLGTVIARRNYKRVIDKNERIRIYNRTFEAQMRMYENDPVRLAESIIFWRQIVNDELF